MAISSTLSSNKRVIYVCKRKSDVTYSEPVKYMVNVETVNSSAEINIYGVNYPSHLSIICTKNIAKQLSVGDKLYFEKTPPKTHNSLQNKLADCNFEIDEIPTFSLNTARIHCTYIKGR